ncbi:hypothetical protein ElyMa_000778800 [Elysia marginata]|uniref:Uncharacterized protein n=1 Tax=Elysia marginata TaxID=1093978 RepID=A0AAV4GW97_9GAST|nr:hypothetical protein ElyMa_000778800 [Elysia marginata]
MCTKSKKLRWADQDVPVSNEKEDLTVPSRLLVKEKACSPSPMRILSTRTKTHIQPPSRVLVQSPSVNCEKLSGAYHDVPGSERNISSTAPSRLPAKESAPSPSPMRISTTGSSKNLYHPPVRVPAQSPSSNRKRAIRGNEKSATPCRPQLLQKFPLSSSSAPCRVKVENAPFSCPRRILVTPSSQNPNQTPVRVPVQSSSLRSKRVLYAHTKKSEEGRRSFSEEEIL